MRLKIRPRNKIAEIVKKLRLRFHKDEGGATAIEYSLIAGIIFLAIVAGMGQVSQSNSEMYKTITDAMEDATS